MNHLSENEDKTLLELSLFTQLIKNESVIGSMLRFGDDFSGGTGDDILNGGDDSDTLIGGLGKDHFDCGLSGDDDTILDYSESEGDTKTNGCEV